MLLNFDFNLISLNLVRKQILYRPCFSRPYHEMMVKVKVNVTP